LLEISFLEIFDRLIHERAFVELSFILQASFVWRPVEIQGRSNKP
jgi:hypothetical protein